MRTLILMIASCFGCVGCIVITPPTCSGTPEINCGPACPLLCNATGSPLSSMPLATVYSVDVNAPTAIGGVGAGYSLSATGAGAWQLVWSGTSDSNLHEFYGSVWTAGTFNSAPASGCGGQCFGLSGNDQLSAAGYANGMNQRIDFDAVVPSSDSLAASGTVGFTFTVDNSDPIYVDLYINDSFLAGKGAPDNTFVFFTSQGALSSPPQIPFGAQAP